MSSLKILVCGNIDGNFAKFFKKISSVQKKNGPFEMVLCCGNFFSDQDECEENWQRVKKKETKVDIPVYILGPTSKKQEKFFTREKKEVGEEVYENVLYLGNKGVFKTTSGLSIAYVCGKEKTNNTKDEGFTKSDMDNLSDQIRRDEKYVGIDILLTSVWPKDVQKFFSKKTSSGNESALISKLASVVKPRYHFSSHEDTFFEPAPYRNHMVLQQEQQHVSRFVAMAPFVNENNQKGLYAFSITPISIISREELIKQPDLVTECPYNVLLASVDDAENTDQGQQFFFRNDDKKRKYDQNNEHRPKKTPKGPPPLSSDCWFCLGSKNVEKHLVVSVGEQSYVALAKGALNDDHVLICPIAHHNSTAVLPDDVRMELEKYKQCLQRMFTKEGKTMVTFERNFYTQHLQLQVVGIPNSLSDDIVDTFEDLAQSNNMEMTVLPEEKDLTELVAVTTPYFFVEIGEDHKLLHRVKGKMPLQFGREVLASPSLLNLPDRVDWKNCKVPKDEETQMTKTFRKRFQTFDFNFL